MLNHTYTSVNNANLVDCGKKQHISSQPSPLLKDNFLGEFRTELDKKKVLANLGIASDLVLEWKNIKGDIGQNKALMEALDARTKYSSELNPDIVTIADGIAYIESILGKDLDAESTQNTRLAALEETTTNLRTDLEAYKDTLSKDLTELNNYITNTVDVEFAALSERIKTIVSDLENINNLITVSDSDTNALKLKVDEHAGLYVENLSPRIDKLDETVGKLGTEVSDINKSLDTFVTIEQLGGDGEFDFVNQSDFSSFSTTVDQRLGNFEKELEKTVKTGEDGHVNNLFVNKISKDNEGNIEVTDSFKVTTNKPLDVRFTVPNIQSLYDLNPDICYAGMGVIVADQSSLYILKQPTEGNKIDDAYIASKDSWKCPEDLVTIALEREEYNQLVKNNQINDSVFYYIYEEDTTEPKRSDYTSDEAYQEAYTNWLKILSQEYMSAAWGVEIERKVSESAKQADVTSLNLKLKQITEGSEGLSLGSLAKSVETLQQTDAATEISLGELRQTLSDTTQTISSDLQSISNSLQNYVTKDALEEASQGFDFVKPSEYKADKEALLASLAAQIETTKLSSETIETSKVVLSNGNLTDTTDGLTYNDYVLAKSSDVPKIYVMSQQEYEDLPTVEDNSYYYTYDGDVNYVTQAEMDTKINTLQGYINLLAGKVDALEKLVATLLPSE